MKKRSKILISIVITLILFFSLQKLVAAQSVYCEIDGVKYPVGARYGDFVCTPKGTWLKVSS
jgi:hypothetical protein